MSVRGVLAETDVYGDEDLREELFNFLDSEDDGGGGSGSVGSSGVLMGGKQRDEGRERGKVSQRDGTKEESIEVQLRTIWLGV